MTDLHAMIVSVLTHHRLIGFVDDDGQPFPLIDMLSSGPDISSGREEILRLADELWWTLEPTARPRDVSTDDGAPASLVRMCPSCGSGDVRWCRISVRPHCEECGRWGPANFGSPEDAVAKWNSDLKGAGHV